MIGYKKPAGRMCHVGMNCYKSYTISLYDLLHPPSTGKNYCGGWSWLCTFVGYNQLRNCMSSPSVGECVGAAVALASDLLFVGSAAKFGVLLAESLLQLGTDTASSVVTLTAADSGSGALARLKAVVGSGDRGAIGREAQVGGEAANYSDDELAQFAYQHSGQGFANGEIRPSLDEIQRTISNGVRSRHPNQNAIRMQTPGVRVIINEDQPWLSTAYYR